MYRSEHILKGLSNQYYRATYKSMGFTTDDLKRPIIGQRMERMRSRPLQPASGRPAGEGRHLPGRRHSH